MSMRIRGLSISSLGLTPVNLSLEQLNDVSIVAPSSGDYLRYNNTAGKWQNSTIDNDVFGFLSTNLVSDGSITITPLSGPNTISLSANITGAEVIGALGYTPVNRAGDTMTGALVLSGDPTVALGAATKQYVDSVASGLNVHPACITATLVSLSATYNNGTSGVGATLTGTGSLPVIGGYAAAINDRILVKDQIDQVENGIYVVTETVGNWVLTRADDFNGSPTSEIVSGDMTYIQQGTLAGTQWVQVTPGTIIVGSSNIVFDQFSGPGTYISGAGIDIAGTTISNTGVLSITGSAGKITASASTGAVTLNLPNDITGLTSVTATSFIGNASSASTLQTARTISATGDATWSVSFNGSSNTTAALTLANTGVTAGTYNNVTVNAKGLITDASNVSYLSGTVPVASGGTGATTAGDARTNLGAQATLVSGTNIKTVNGATLLGSGNVDTGGAVNGIIKCNGSGLFSQAIAGTDYLAPTSLNSYLPLAGGTLTGTLQVNGANLILNSTSDGNNGVLQVRNQTAVTTLQAYSDTSSSWLGTVESGKDLRLFTAGTERVRIDGSGNVGIAGASLGDRLQVAGNIRAVLTGGGGIYLADQFNTVSIRSIPASSDSAMGFYTQTSTERMRIDASGRIGMGGSPSATSILKAYGDLELDDTSRSVYSNNYGSVSSTAVMRFRSNNQFVWSNSTDLSEYMRIDASGNVGIGTTTPRASLANASGRTAFGKDEADYHWFRTNDNISEPNCIGYGFTSNGISVNRHEWKVAGTTHMVIDSSGNVGIGTVSPASKLAVVGTVTATAFNATSTAAVKERIQDLSDSYLDRFDQLRPREYDRRDYSAHEFGFIAEEVEEIYPEIVGKDSDGKPIGIDYSRLSTILVAKINRQQEQIDHLSQLVARLLGDLSAS